MRGYRAQRILTPEGWRTDHTVYVRDGVFSQPERDTHPSVEDLGAGWLVPGFIDVQVNGGGGALFNDDPSPDTIAVIADAHRRFGTCALTPTLISDDLSKVDRAMRAVEAAMDQGVPGVIGVHLEGPFLNAGKRGIHDARYFRALDDEAVALLSSLRTGVTVVTLAPETVAPEQITQLRDAGVRVCLGHSLADYDQAKAAEDAGVTGYTHLFNAMTPIASRAPGAVTAALEGAAWCGIIADGHHVAWPTLRLAVRAKRDARIMLVSDAMPGVGAAIDRFMLGGREIRIEGGRCMDANGTLAGSHLSMGEGVANAHRHLDLSVAEAVALAAHQPAAFLGLGDQRGAIAPGFVGDFVHVSAELEVLGTAIAGVYQAVDRALA